MTTTYAETQSLSVDDYGVVWLRLVLIDDEDDFARLGPISWGVDVPHGLRGELAKLEDEWQDGGRDNHAEDQRHAYMRAIGV